VGEDYVHLFQSASPSFAPSLIAHILQGTTAPWVFQHFPARQETALGGTRHGLVRTTWTVLEI
jgi:hypothetical protein